VHRRAIAFAAAAVVAATSVATAQKRDTVPTFEQLDMQAQFLMDYLRCSANSFNALQSGVIAPLDSGTHILCAVIKDRMTSAFVKADSSWKRPIKLSILDPVRMVERREPTDTAEILVLLRAQRYADWLTWKDSAAGPRGLPVVYRADTVIHVWIFPLVRQTDTSRLVGGERHYVFPSDAKKEISAAPVPPVRPVLRVGGSWLIKSVGDSIPTLSEILAAYVLAEDRQEVTIELPKRFLKLVTATNAGAWIWLPKKP
jgi:hypothetical protein